jgi:hypothetical protein
MSEYEVMHMHESGRDTSSSGILLSDEPELQQQPRPVRVVIRRKESHLTRLSKLFTITRLLGHPAPTDNTFLIGPGGRTRQDPDMKLKQRWILALFIIFSIVLILILSSVQFRNITKLTSHQLGITVDLEELTERKKCPACFGINLCPAVINGKIELNDWNKFAMSRLVNVKNVFYATWDDRGTERQVRAHLPTCNAYYCVCNASRN